VRGVRHHFYLAVTLMLLLGPLALGNDSAALVPYRQRVCYGAVGS